TPDGFIVIDDKPGTKTFRSNINQIYGYCLAFKKMMIERQDPRPITAALRERGTDNIYWRAPFDETAENEIIEVINHVHGLISGSEQFISSGNPNKCKACRFKNNCDRFMEPSNFWDSI
ncbi:MAG: CRISPR-associated protein Cas4, partial [Gammaproteobacteria bacterium]|nr:CRISPR-associated protein Cas4 [Gammaproteobacteria bacterium]